MRIFMFKFDGKAELCASAGNLEDSKLPQQHGPWHATGVMPTLAADCEVEYLITPEYLPSAARSIRWDDPSLAIAWPIKEGVTISSRVRQLPAFDFAGMGC